MTAFRTLALAGVGWRQLAFDLHVRSGHQVFLAHVHNGKPSPMSLEQVQVLADVLDEAGWRTLVYYVKGYAGLDHPDDEPCWADLLWRKDDESWHRYCYQTMLMDRSAPIRARLAELTKHPAYFSILAIAKRSDCIHLVRPEDRPEFCKLLARYNGYCAASRES